MVLLDRVKKLRVILGDSVKAPSAILISRLIASILALAGSPIVARAIGPEGRGLTAAAITVLTLVPIGLALGLPWAVRRQSVIENDSSDVLRSARIIALFSVVPATAIGAALCFTILAELDIWSKIFLIIGLILTPGLIIRNCQISIMVVKSQYFNIFLVTVAQPAVYFVSIAILFVLHLVTVATVIGSYVFAIAFSYCATSTLNSVAWLGSRAPIAKLIRESFSAAGAQISEIASYRLNQLILLPLIGAHALGQYAVATNVALAPAPIGPALATSSFRSIAEADRNRVADTIRSSFRGVVVVAFAATLSVSILAPIAVPLAFGSEFLSAVPATLILSVGAFLVICNSMMTSCLMAINKGKKASLAHYLGFLVGMCLLFLLSFQLGLVGAAISAVLGFLVTSTILSRSLSIGLRDWLPRIALFKPTVMLIFRRVPLGV
ncbi:oligosaccharide flippase family protein [Rhodococcus globerulus]|uniref:Oligosaccharide flippase family protein n=1 Tax=Rhodococcus globerulus TaxID=33008 RepID=A0ABU4BQP4_RHOGO|nr:oligosaccharide flippase family protein [Rhodococcus globerulus]MDV6266541.1 oligosaccharide flippase family protein [Rhodococcus globerulus]